MFACFVILSFTGETINECLLVLHTAATGVCQLYLALLHLRRAGQHFVIAWHIDYTADCINENVLWYGTQSEHILKPRRKGAAAVHFLEGACLLWESLSLFLAVVSTVCVAVRHVLQAALFLIISTVRWPQKMLLSKEDLDEWEKEQKKEKGITGAKTTGGEIPYCCWAFPFTSQDKKKLIVATSENRT